MDLARLIGCICVGSSHNWLGLQMIHIQVHMDICSYES